MSPWSSQNRSSRTDSTGPVYDAAQSHKCLIIEIELPLPNFFVADE